MGIFDSATAAPKPPPLPPRAAPPPTLADPSVGKAKSQAYSLGALAASANSTILTSPQGLVGDGYTAKKTLLGQ